MLFLSGGNTWVGGVTTDVRVQHRATSTAQHPSRLSRAAPSDSARLGLFIVPWLRALPMQAMQVLLAVVAPRAPLPLPVRLS